MAKTAAINPAKSTVGKKANRKGKHARDGGPEKIQVDNRTWTLPKQEQYLKGRYTVYKEVSAAKSSNNFNAFWATTRSRFYTLYPNEEAELKEWAIIYRVAYTPPKGAAALNDGTLQNNIAGGNDASTQVDTTAPDMSESSMPPNNPSIPRAPAGHSTPTKTAVPAGAAAIATPAINPASAIIDAPASTPDMFDVEPRIPARIGNDGKWKEERNKQMRNWMNNRMQSEKRTNRSKGIAPPVQAPVNLAGVLKPSKMATAGRVRSEEQIYSTIYYVEKIKALVDAEIAATNAPFSDRIRIRTQFVKDAYAGESDDVKEEIRQLRRQEEEKRSEAAEILSQLVEDGGVMEYSPEQYARVQEYLPYIIPHFFSIIGPASGWSFMVVGGGPQTAKENGEIGFVLWCEGLLPGKVGFDDWVENWEDNFVAPFGKFCHALFPEEVRLQRAINIAQNGKLSADALERSGRGIGKLVYTNMPEDRAPGSLRRPTKTEGVAAPVAVREGKETEELILEPDVGSNKKQGGGSKLGHSLADRVDDVNAGAAAFGVTLTEFGRLARESQEKMRRGMASLAAETGEALALRQQIEQTKAAAQLTRDHADYPSPIQHLPPPAQPDPRSGRNSPSSLVLPARISLTHGTPPRIQRKDSVAAPSPWLSHSPTSEYSRYPSRSPTPICPIDPSLVDLLIVPEPSQSPEPREPAASRSKRKAATEVETQELPERREKRLRKAVEDWVTEAHAFLSEAAKGSAWSTCVQAWYDFETKGFYGASTLEEKASRPAELSTWMAKRNYNNRKIADESDYGNRWMDWWGHLLGGDSSKKARSGRLRRGGKNGFVVALVGLAFWAKVGKEDERWWNTVDEMIQVFQ